MFHRIPESPFEAAETVIIADASKVSPGQFLRRVRNAFAPAPSRAEDRAIATSRFITASWGQPCEVVEANRAQLTADLEAIDAHWDAKDAQLLVLDAKAIGDGFYRVEM